MINIENIKQNIGNYIRFGGKGIMDGLKQKKNKDGFYRILEAKNEMLILQRYRKRRRSVFPSSDYDQDYEIITPKEFKLLPIY